MAQYGKVYKSEVTQFTSLSKAALILFCYYKVKHSERDGGWRCPMSLVLADLPEFDRRSYFRAKKELIKKDWVTFRGDFVTPIGPPEIVPDLSPNSAKNDTEQGAELVTELSLKSASFDTNFPEGVPDLSPNSATFDTVYKDTEHTDPSNTTEHTEHSIVQPEEPASPLSEEAVGKSDRKKPKSKGKKSKPEVEVKTDDVVTVFDYWKKVTNHPKAKLIESRIKRIRKRLGEGFTVQELCQCLDGWKRSQWHQGQNPTQTIYDKVDTIFRDGEQVETFMARAERKNVVPIGDNGLIIPEPAPVSFGEAMEMNFLIYCPSGDPQELFDETKQNYLAKNKGEKFVAEVVAYQNSDEFRERLEKARP